MKQERGHCSSDREGSTNCTASEAALAVTAVRPVSRSVGTTGWNPPEDLDLPQWAALGRRFGQIARGVQWWIGDWLRYGSLRWGERYVQASRITGYDQGSLRNMASLSSEFEVSRRRDGLTWSHHAVVAGLELRDQDAWLDRAELLRLSVADFRVELRAGRRGSSLSDDGMTPSVLARPMKHHCHGASDGNLQSMGDVQPSVAVVCPKCGQPLPQPTG